MWIATANLGGKLDAMLAAGEFAAIASQSGQDDATVFARGVALGNLGRLAEARDAFAALANSTNFADAAAVEHGFLDLNTPEGPAAVAAAMHDLTPRLAGTLAGRAQHLLGVSEFRQMHIGDALDALARAQKAYHETACEPGEAQVLDTQGMVHQWMGNESAALVHTRTRLRSRTGSAIASARLSRLAISVAIARCWGGPKRRVHFWRWT